MKRYRYKMPFLIPFTNINIKNYILFNIFGIYIFLVYYYSERDKVCTNIFYALYSTL